MKTLHAALLMTSLILAPMAMAGEPATTSAQPAVAASSQQAGQGTAKVVPCDDKAPGAKPCPKQVASPATGSTATPTAAPAK